MFQRIRKHTGESCYTDTSSCSKYNNDLYIKCLYSFHNKEILSKQYQYKTTRYTRKNHCTDSNSSTQKDKQQVRRSFGGCCYCNIKCYHTSYNKSKNCLPVPFLDIFSYEPGRGKNQTEKEWPHQNRMICQQPSDNLCQWKYTNSDTGQKEKQEITIYHLPKGSPPSGKKHFQTLGIDTLYWLN